MPQSTDIIARMPKLSEDEMRAMLTPPAGPVRIVLDTDTANEIDDQFALAWTLLSPDKLKLEGVYAEPFSFQHHQAPLLRAHDIVSAPGGSYEQLPADLASYGSWLRGLASAGTDPRDVRFVDPAEGMELSYQEILTVFDKLGANPDGLVFRGSDHYLPALAEPLRTPAAEHLIERARNDGDEPLYVVAIGCITNVISAILLEPEIIKHIVVIWTSAYPSTSTQPNAASLNLVQDVESSRFLFDCGVPHVYLPGFHIGAQLRLSLPEMEAWVRGKGAMGDYLYWLYTHNPIYEQRGITGHFARSWVIWDIINIAWLLNPDWVPSELLTSPILGADTVWQHNIPGRHQMREAYAVDRDAIFHDLFTKLDQAAKSG